MNAPKRGILATITNFFMVETRNRLEELNATLDADPDNASLLLLRGELWLEVGALDSAINDFEAARQLAEAALPTARWGYLNEVIAERARENLRRCGIEVR